MWIKNRGVENLLSLTQLEQYGYCLTHGTLKDWFMHAAYVTKIVFKRDTGLCNRMQYLDMSESQVEFSMLQTVRNNF